MTNYLDQLAQFFEGQITKYGYKRYLAFPLGMAMMLNIAGFFLGNPMALWLVTNLAVILYLFLTVIALIVSRRRLVQEHTQQKRIIDRYTKKLNDVQLANAGYFEIVKWSETLLVSAFGDTTITRDFVLRAGADGVDTFSSLCYSNDQAPPKDKVEVTVRELKSDGTLGARWENTVSWETPNKQRVFVHFDDFIPPGEEFAVQFKWQWPGYSADLINGHPEPMQWKINRKCSSLACSIIFDPSSGIEAPPNVSLLPGTPKASAKLLAHTPEGQHRVDFVMDHIPQGSFGFRVDKK